MAWIVKRSEEPCDVVYVSTIRDKAVACMLVRLRGIVYAAVRRSMCISMPDLEANGRVVRERGRPTGTPMPRTISACIRVAVEGGPSWCIIIRAFIMPK